MKRITLIISMAVLGCVTAFAQLASKHLASKFNADNRLNSQSADLARKHSKGNVSRNGNGQNQTQSIIWTDDFSTPANWAITTEAGTAGDWVIGTNGPSGGYLIDPIASTSAANGFALYDSDLMCGGNQIGNLTNVTPINCTGHSSVRLTFQEYYRRFLDSTYVYVSNNGTTWTLFNTVNANVIVNDFCGGGTAGGINPTNIALNISSVAGNQATVYVRFTFFSPSSLGTGSGCSYSWMVDDVVVEDAPTDDVAMVKPHVPGPYTFVPLSQAQPIELEAKVTNFGAQVETNIGFTATIYQNFVGPIFNGPSATVASLNPGDTSALLSAGSWTPVDTGLYFFEYIVFMNNADGDAINDTLYQYMFVSDSTYARDYANIDGQITNQIGFNGAAGSIAQSYDVYNASMVTSVTAWFHSAAVGDEVAATVHSMAGGIPDVILGASAVYTTTAADTGGLFMTFEIVPPVAVGVGQFAVSFDQVGLVFVGLGFTNNVYTPTDNFYNTGTGWVIIDTIGTSGGGAPVFAGAFMVRPNLNLSVGMDENLNAKNFEIFPNPVNGMLYFKNNNKNISDFTLNIMDAVGKVVYTKMYSNLANASVDVSKMANGVYTVQFKSDADVITKSIVVSNK